MTADRSKAEKRLIRVMEKRGGRGFRILRSAERPIKRYTRIPATPAPTTDETRTFRCSCICASEVDQ